MSRSDYGGRVLVLGNIHPTSFADISDKFVWLLDTDKDEVTPYCVWEKEDSYYELDWKQGVEGVPSLHTAQFVRVVGEAASGELSKVSKLIYDLWKKLPNALMIRNDVVVPDLPSFTPVKQTTVHKYNVVETIKKDLEGKDIGELFNSYVEED
jgi:hypothetical protein